MNKSESIAKLAEALSKAQGAMKNAIKDSDNPFFKSKYADLASVADVCRPEFAANGLAVTQLPEMREGKLVLTYVLMHSSGEWISGELEMSPVKSDPQGIGSAITYARRYTLAGVAGIATEDDDGNAASGNHAPDNGNGKSRKTFGNGSPAGNKASEGATQSKGQTAPSQTGDPDVEKIDKGASANLHMTFRGKLQKSLQPKSDQLLADFLAHEGYVDADLKPSALMIPRHLFQEVKKTALEHAATL